MTIKELLEETLEHGEVPESVRVTIRARVYPLARSHEAIVAALRVEQKDWADKSALALKLSSQSITEDERLHNLCCWNIYKEHAEFLAKLLAEAEKVSQ